MKYALAALVLLSACSPATNNPTPEPPGDPSDVARECTQSASDRLEMGEPGFNIYNECVKVCKETTNPSYCIDRAKNWINLSESILGLKSNL